MSNKPRAKQPKADAWSLDDFLADYRPLERAVSITTRGDLVGQLTELEDQLDAARDTSDTGGLADSSDAIVIAEQISDLREQVRASSRTFKFASIGDRAWSDLVARHPADEEEKAQGLPWHAETFYAEAISLSVVEPQISTQQADKLLEILSAGQTRKLIGALLDVNGGADELPKSDASYVLRQASKRKQTTASREAFLDPDSLAG